MKIAIMQPYVFPYIGYFQLMNAVDEFVVYDNIEFTKKGWINRNRILVNGKDDYISFPLKKDPDQWHVVQRCLAENWESDRKKILNRIKESYRRSPCFDSVYPVIEKAVLFEDHNLFRFILNSLYLVKEFLQIKTPFIIASGVSIDHDLKAGKKVMAICKARKADTYLNPIGGVELYDKEEFRKEGIELEFLKTTDISYKQFDNSFVPSLSIIDVMMFNPIKKIKEYLDFGYTIV